MGASSNRILCGKRNLVGRMGNKTAGDNGEMHLKIPKEQRGRIYE